MINIICLINKLVKYYHDDVLNLQTIFHLQAFEPSFIIDTISYFVKLSPALLIERNC